MARPSALSPVTAAALYAARSKGNSDGACAYLAGIGVRTLYDWLKRGERGEEPYATFSRNYRKSFREFCDRKRDSLLVQYGLA